MVRKIKRFNFQKQFPDSSIAWCIHLKVSIRDNLSLLFSKHWSLRTEKKMTKKKQQVTVSQNNTHTAPGLWRHGFRFGVTGSHICVQVLLLFLLASSNILAKLNTQHADGVVHQLCDCLCRFYFLFDGYHLHAKCNMCSFRYKRMLSISLVLNFYLLT